MLCAKSLECACVQGKTNLITVLECFCTGWVTAIKRQQGSTGIVLDLAQHISLDQILFGHILPSVEKSTRLWMHARVLEHHHTRLQT